MSEQGDKLAAQYHAALDAADQAHESGPARPRPEALIEYMETGGPHGGVPAMVETDSPVWRDIIATIRALLAENERLEAERDAAVDEFQEARNTSYLERAEAAERRVAELREALAHAHICEHIGTSFECPHAGEKEGAGE